METLRLPRTVEDEPGAAQRARGAIRALVGGRRSARCAGRIVRELEGAQRALSVEQQGLEHVDRKTAVERGRRVSRLLILADDGSERFYREVESLLRRNAPRVLAAIHPPEAATPRLNPPPTGRRCSKLK